MKFRVYKADVRRFIEAVKHKAVASVIDERQKLINESKEARTAHFRSYKNGTVETLLDVVRALENLPQEESIEFIRYSQFRDGIYKLRSAIVCFNSSSFGDIKENEAEQVIMEKYEQRITEVKREYNKLIAFVDTHTAKESYMMLKELGFDVSSLECTPNALPTTQVDKSKLFVCGDNKWEEFNNE